MDIKLLGRLVEQAIDTAPTDAMREACDGYYEPYYHLIYLLAQHMAPCVVVELGVAYGRFLRCAALAGADLGNAIVGIDTVRYPDIAATLAMFEQVAFINAPSVPRPMYVPTEIDILHIDSLHSYAHAKGEFEAYKDLLNDGAVVMFDDLYAGGDTVLRYFNELPYSNIQDDRLHPANIHNPCGYGVMIYTKDLQDEESSLSS